MYLYLYPQPQFFSSTLDSCNCRFPYGLMGQVFMVWKLTYDQAMGETKLVEGNKVAEGVGARQMEAENDLCSA